MLINKIIKKKINQPKKLLSKKNLTFIVDPGSVTGQSEIADVKWDFVPKSIPDGDVVNEAFFSFVLITLVGSLILLKLRLNSLDFKKQNKFNYLATEFNWNKNKLLSARKNMFLI